MSDVTLPLGSAAGPRLKVRVMKSSMRRSALFIIGASAALWSAIFAAVVAIIP